MPWRGREFLTVAPKFSVIIPTYNHADFLKESLRSVLDQTFEDFEVIVVNNHSTDHTLEVVQQMADPRVRVINFANHGVIGASRNVGIKESTGGYVAFLDSDDSWHNHKLDILAKVFEENPDVGVICHNQELLWYDGTVQQSRYGPPEKHRGDLYDYLLLTRNCLSTSATAVARPYLDQVGYFSDDPSFVTVEDYDLWLRLSKVCPFYFFPGNLGTQNFHSDSSTSRAELHLRNALALLDKHCGEYLAGKGLLARAAVRRRYAKAYYFAARQYQRQGATKKPFAYLLKTLRTYPFHPFHARAYGSLALLLGDSLLGRSRRKTITKALWGPSWRWG